MNDKGLVSAITIFLNGENFIEEAIQSVLSQTYANWELILVDDGSTDGSTEIARRYEKAHPEKIRYVDHACHENRGMSASRNLGLRHARGEYVAFLDHDDIWLPNKLEDQVAILVAQPEAAMMYGRTRYWHGWTGRPEDSERDSFTFLGVEPNRIVAGPDLFTLFLRDDGTTASTCSVLIRREVFERVGGFDETFRDQYEDMVFLAKVYLESSVYVSDRCWDYYRQHGNNSGAHAFLAGQWHPERPNPAREKFLKRLERYVSEKHVTNNELLAVLQSELLPYRNRDNRDPYEALHCLCSDAALALLRGEDPYPLIGAIGDMCAQELTGDTVAQWFFDAVPPQQIGEAHVWTRRWPRLEKRVGQYMEALELKAQALGLAADAMRALERRVHNKWCLRADNGATAHLQFPLENPDMLRVVMGDGVAGNSYDIQLNQALLSVKANHRYVLTFLARADEQRTICLGVAKAQEPWTNLGLYREIALTSEWQSFEIEFTVSEDEDKARVHFDIGSSNISTEVSAVSLRSISEARYVQPTLRSKPDDQVVLERALDESSVPVGKVQFGSFLRATPISREWGWDRGLPVDRYYTEKFLALHSNDIRGHVLEIGDNSYGRKFGGNQVAQIDVLDASAGNPQVTIVADIANAPHIPSNTFDCIILTQTLQLTYDVQAAVEELHRILKPGGVLLATIPGISQTHDPELAKPWYWNFTSSSAHRLFQNVFPADKVKVDAFGNVLSAMSFLHGLSANELTRHELGSVDRGYEVTIAVRALKEVKVALASNGVRRQSVVRQREPEAKALILMYHRVAEVGADPFSLCVTPDHFADHMDALRKVAQPVRLQHLAGHIQSGRFPRRLVAVTFDDGYLDNLRAAKPLLERFDVPATVFVTTGNLGQDREFWWDELERIFLEPGTLPRALSLRVRGATHEWNLGESYYYSKNAYRRYRRWTAEEQPPTARHLLHSTVWKLLQPLPEADRRQALDELLFWAGIGSESRPAYRSLSAQEVRDLSRGGLIEIGAHSVTHPVLCDLPSDMQYDEIQRSKVRLEEIVNDRVISFAYPYGALSPETAAIVRQTGFSYGCSTVSHAVQRGADPFQLPRIEINDWDGKEFANRLAAWFESSEKHTDVVEIEDRSISMAPYSPRPGSDGDRHVQ